MKKINIDEIVTKIILKTSFKTYHITIFKTK